MPRMVPAQFSGASHSFQSVLLVGAVSYALGWQLAAYTSHPLSDILRNLFLSALAHFYIRENNAYLLDFNRIYCNISVSADLGCTDLFPFNNCYGTM